MIETQPNFDSRQFEMSQSPEIRVLHHLVAFLESDNVKRHLDGKLSANLMKKIAGRLIYLREEMASEQERFLAAQRAKDQTGSPAPNTAAPNDDETTVSGGNTGGTGETVVTGPARGFAVNTTAAAHPASRPDRDARSYLEATGRPEGPAPSTQNSIGSA